jgi:hypothetical protein
MSDLKSLIKILSLLVILVPCVGRAANWKSMGSTPVAKFYHDADQLVGEQENRKLVVKVNYAEETKDGTRSALQEIFVNCIDRTYSIGTVKRYGLIDLQGGEKTIPATGRKQSPAQGTLGEDYIKRACESAPKNSGANTNLYPADATSKTQISGNAPMFTDVTADDIRRATKEVQITPSQPSPAVSGGRSSTNTLQATQATQVQRPVAFAHVNKMSPDQIRDLLLLKTWEQWKFDNFLLNYSFIYSINKNMFTIGGDYDHLNIPHREAMSPFQANIKKSLQDMDSVIANIAKAIQVQPSVIYKAFGIELEEKGVLKEYNTESISTGRLLASDYWFRFPGKQKSVNEWYDARDPSLLFGEFYPVFASGFNRDIVKLSNHANLYENNKLNEVKKREEREQWLQTTEGKKHLADEEIKRKREQQERQKFEVAEAARIAREFPFFAEVTCNNGGYGNFQIHACFTGSQNIQFELHNGSDYQFYTLPDIFNLSARSGRNSEAIINLKNKFQIKMQNAGGDWILGLRIIKRQSGEVVFQKKVSGFGVISVKN